MQPKHKSPAEINQDESAEEKQKDFRLPASLLFVSKDTPRHLLREMFAESVISAFKAHAPSGLCVGSAEHRLLHRRALKLQQTWKTLFKTFTQKQEVKVWC